MRTIGLLGGMSWESTALYYRMINEQVRTEKGGLASARVLIHSFDFEEIVACQKQNDWTRATEILAAGGRGLHQAGAEALLICTNTMHKIADAVAAQVPVPLIHIGDTTGAALRKAGCKQPVLLATAYTMEQAFLTDHFLHHYNIKAQIPDQEDRAFIHETIFGQLCRGVVCSEARARFLEIIEKAKNDGADSVILGCTEICLLIGCEDVSLPVFDSTTLHAAAAGRFVLGLDTCEKAA